MPAKTESQAEEMAPQTCRNCGAPVDGAYCSTCGQETKLRLPTLREFLREAAGRYVALDGRFWRTVFALLVRPGFLTREYLAGRRRRYIRPARLYLFATLIFFAVTRLLVGPIDIFEVHPDTPEEAKYLSPEQGLQCADGGRRVRIAGVAKAMEPLQQSLARTKRPSSWARACCATRRTRCSCCFRRSRCC